jgi:hypothetical protein
MDMNQIIALIKATNADQRATMFVQIGFAIIFFIASGIVIKNLLERNRTLKVQLASQESIMSSMKSFMSIFKIEEVEKYVKLNEKKFKLEKEAAIEKLEKTAKRSIEFYLKEFDALIGFALGVINKAIFFPSLDELIEKMDDSLSKNALKIRRKEVDDQIRKLLQDPDFMAKGLEKYFAKK